MSHGSGKYTYEVVDRWAKLPKDWSFVDVCGVSIDSQDKVYILNRGAHPVMVFDQDGNFLTSWGEGFFKRAHGSYVGPDDSVYCADDGHHTVCKFTPKGKLIMELGNRDTPSDTGFVHTPGLGMTACLHTIKRSGPPFNRPTGVALSPSGEIYVSDGYGNARVHKFTPDGKLLFSWGEPGYAPSQFKLPHSVWVDKENRVWVVDRENNRIQIFNAQGEFLSQWTDLIRPCDVYIGDDGVAYVLELCLRVSIFSPTGTVIARWGNEVKRDKEKSLFLAPHTIAVDSRGDIYVGEVAQAYCGVDRGLRSLQKFVRIK